MKIITVFDHLGEILRKYTCLVENISIPCQVNAVPDGTQTFVLIFEDMDALPVPGTHWMVFDIPASVTIVPEGRVPDGGTPGLANNHTFGYEGPCPKYFEGIHHYRLVVFALDRALELSAASEKRDVLEAMQTHVIEQAEVVGLCTALKSGEPGSA